jgi:YHS domain-containing protein
MRRIAVLLSAALTLAACDATTAPQPSAQSDVRTISSAPLRPAALEPPPTLQDEAPPPKPKTMPWETPTPIVFTPEDEKLRASLPFTPAIAMDAMDGSKISMRAATPTFEYKGKIYYFSSEEHKRAFMAQPDMYAKGAFTKL